MASSSRLSLFQNLDEVQYEVQVFKFGELGGSLTACTPALCRISRNSTVNRGSRSWIKYRFPVRKPSSASLRLRATWLIPSPFASRVTPAISTRRLESD